MNECLFELADVRVHKPLQDGDLPRESGCSADFQCPFLRTGFNLGRLDNLEGIPLPGLSMHGSVNTRKTTCSKLCADIIVCVDPLGLQACCHQPKHKACKND